MDFLFDFFFTKITTKVTVLMSVTVQRIQQYIFSLLFHQVFSFILPLPELRTVHVNANVHIFQSKTVNHLIKTLTHSFLTPHENHHCPLLFEAEVIKLK